MRDLHAARRALLRRASLALALVAALAPPARAQEAAPEGEDPATAADEPSIDGSTPRRLLASFLASAREGTWDVAVDALDLREVPIEQRVEAGHAAARDLEMVLSAAHVVPLSLPDEPEPGGDRAIEIMRVEGVEQAVVLRRLRSGTEPEWRFSAATVRAASLLADRIDRGPIGDRMPDWLRKPRVLWLEPWQWIALPVAIVLALLGAWVFGVALRAVARPLAARTGIPVTALVLDRLRRPAHAASFLAILGLLATLIRFAEGGTAVLGRLYGAAWVLLGGWVFWEMVDLVVERIEERAADRDDWRARGTQTRATLLRRVLHITGVVIASAIVLLQFDAVRQLGVSLLASAGVAGIVLGIAAQRTLGNVFAGIQLSITQPLRVGDQIGIANEVGTVEEINLSYVVLRLWDRRRLILPIPKLLETPFENWTRLGTDIVGTVLVPVDLATPFAIVRAEVERYVATHSLFDGGTLRVEVFGAEERSATMRVVLSARDSTDLTRLECDVREFALAFLQGLDGGLYLPRVRLDERSPALTLGRPPREPRRSIA